jgi:hypothetical protein
MRKQFFLILLSLLIFDQSIIAQEKPQGELNQLLAFYFNIKNALVENDSNSAAINAKSFLNVAKVMNHHLIYEGDLHALILDAVTISETKDLKKQRSCFCNFSANMGVIVNSIKMGSGIIFKQYCPLKRASWLSSERVIKNPYHGIGIDNGDEVIEIIQ